MEPLPLEDVIRMLGLKPLTGEGGLWCQTYLSGETLPGGTLPRRATDRPVASAIHFLLTPAAFSRMHRLVTDEIWYYHMGAPVELLLLYPDGTCAVPVLGCGLAAGERPQITVPRGTWMGACLRGDGPYSLLSTSMAPAYADSDFEAGTWDRLRPLLSRPDLEPLLRRLTGEPRYS